MNSPSVRRVGLVLTCVLLGTVILTGYRLASDITAALDKITSLLPLPG